MVTVLLCFSSFLLNFSMALKTWAVTLRSLARVLNPLQLINSITLDLEATLTIVSAQAAHILSSTIHSLGIDTGFKSTQGSTPNCNHSGPRRHSWFTETSNAVSPLDGRSAGLDFPGQWLQSVGLMLLRISATLFSMKGFHSLFVPCIQNRATCESV